LAVTKGNGGTAPNNSANGTSKAWIEKQSNGSRLGFRGNEDLGGGSVGSVPNRTPFQSG